MKANALMKANVDALLRARKQTRRDLAQWCRRTDAWIGKIMAEDRREFPMKYWDRIADFFGIGTYQLLQPGLSPYFERRKVTDRRTGRDRRVSSMNYQVRESVSSVVADLSPADVADVIRWRALSPESREAARQALQELERADRQGAASRRGRRLAGSAGAVAKATGTRGRHPALPAAEPTE